MNTQPESAGRLLRWQAVQLRLQETNGAAAALCNRDKLQSTVMARQFWKDGGQ